MLKVIGFILTSITDFMKMLFTIDLGDNMSLGLLMCICFIFLPIVHRVICFIKQDAMEELDDMYDSTRPINTTSASYIEHASLGSGKRYRYVNTVTRKRRVK